MNKIITIGITGIKGFIGWHLNCFLNQKPGIEVRGAGRKDFSDKNRLLNFVKSCDFIVHLAGINKGSEKELFEINADISKSLIAACKAVDFKGCIFFASSTHIYKNSIYGKAKKFCSKLLSQWANNSKGNFTNMILPHVFGEQCTPFYNSVIATFCYQIANGQATKIDNNIELELIHAQDVCRRIFEFISNFVKREEVCFPGVKITVKDVLTKLTELADLYNNQIIPDLSNDFNLQLFNTYRSYIFPKYYPVKIPIYSDQRGDLFETVKAYSKGKCFVSTTQPGFTRGNHYHLLKFERFLILEGRALISLRRLFTDKVIKFELDGQEPAYVDIPTFYTHNIKNIGKNKLITLFWSNKIKKDLNIDTFYENV
ncbi:MAG: NAD-dependent epimerase/dehydratase family protein [Candidatus Omnitrophica bacterium]|nr:NAD-dependent epimerase/dehydratase family protein [Candidatus Omnitrophota bacterium]